MTDAQKKFEKSCIDFIEHTVSEVVDTEKKPDPARLRNSLRALPEVAHSLIAFWINLPDKN